MPSGNRFLASLQAYHIPEDELLQTLQYALARTGHTDAQRSANSVMLHSKHDLGTQTAKPSSEEKVSPAPSGKPSREAEASAQLLSSPRRVLVCKEKEYLDLSCPAAQKIHLSAWNFGRTSKDDCINPKEGDPGEKLPPNGRFSIECRSRNNHLIKDQCHGKQACRILSHASHFKEDPCYGTPKYLEVTYQCQAG